MPPHFESFMRYRWFEEKDGESIKFLCDKNQIALPHPESSILVAEDEGQIEGFAGLVNLTFLEPLISDNPIAAVKLFDLIQGILINQKIKNLYCYCDPDKRELFEKAGFSVFQENKILMKKEIG